MHRRFYHMKLDNKQIHAINNMRRLKTYLKIREPFQWYSVAISITKTGVDKWMCVSVDKTKGGTDV